MPKLVLSVSVEIATAVSSKMSAINPLLVRWGNPGYLSNHGEILEHPGGRHRIKTMEYLNIFKKTTPCKSKAFIIVQIVVFKISRGSHLTNKEITNIL